LHNSSIAHSRKSRLHGSKYQAIKAKKKLSSLCAGSLSVKIACSRVFPSPVAFACDTPDANVPLWIPMELISLQGKQSAFVSHQVDKNPRVTRFTATLGNAAQAGNNFTRQ